MWIKTSQSLFAFRVPSQTNCSIHFTYLTCLKKKTSHLNFASESKINVKERNFMRYESSKLVKIKQCVLSLHCISLTVLIQLNLFIKNTMKEHH